MRVSNDVMRAATVVLMLVVGATVGCQAQNGSQPARSRGGSGPATGSAPAPTVDLDQRREAPLPQPRQEVASTAGDELGLWVIGGFDGDRVSTPTVYRYRDGRWAQEPDLPLGLNHPAAAVLEDTVYVAGGYAGDRPSARVFALRGPREVTSLKHARGALALVAAGGRLYAIGGVGQDGQVGPAEEYDPRTRRWTDLPALPLPRDHVAGFAWQDMPCIAGGRSPNTAKVHCLDPRSRRWTTMPDLPAATSGAGGGALGDRVMVAGGEDPGNRAMIDQIAVFDQGTWAVDRMNVPRHGIALATYQDRLWACGGGTRAGLDVAADCTSIR